ncbi:hypothetical protein Scep_000040 [Stephania cephalantha]|uniref:3-beta hydroxysteroid dehydrogenase/isomerase domain-containing protein n=1 Tax=Stephania cephalantha TaxID=152367 RepID=A0AAP0L9I2_9MAGN
MGDEKETVCVTGAGGYQASWLVKLLLLRGYKVHGTVRDPAEMIGPAVEGTYNVLKACSKAKVKKVVMVSSVVAVFMKPNLTKDQILDETCWSDKEYCGTNDELKEVRH